MNNYAEMPAWYDWAYGISEIGLYLVCVLAMVLLVVLTTLGVAAYRGRASRAVPSTLPPGFVTAVVLPISLVISLLVNDIWRKYSDAQDTVVAEASTVADAVRAIHRLPADPYSELNGLMYAYVHGDVVQDWRTYQTRRVPIETRSALNEMEFRVARLLQSPQIDLPARATLAVLASDLTDLDKLRKKRTQLSAGRLDNSRWAVLCVLLLTGLTVLVEVVYGQRKNYFVSVGLFVMGYGTLVYMLVTHDRPFSGETIVSYHPIAEAYANQLKSFKAR